MSFSLRYPRFWRKKRPFSTPAAENSVKRRKKGALWRQPKGMEAALPPVGCETLTLRKKTAQPVGQGWNAATPHAGCGFLAKKHADGRSMSARRAGGFAAAVGWALAGLPGWHTPNAPATLGAIPPLLVVPAGGGRRAQPVPANALVILAQWGSGGAVS